MNRGIGKMTNKIIAALVIGVWLVGATAIAEDKKWFIIKGKSGVCRVISASDKTPKTIAGPYDTKEEAQQSKAKLCGDTSKKSEKKEKKEESFASKAGKWVKDTVGRAIESALNTAIRRQVDDMFK